MFDFVGKRRWFLLASAIIILAGVISMAIPGGLKLGIDFRGGIGITLGPKVGDTLTIEQVEEQLNSLGYTEAANRIQVLSEGDFYIRTGELSADEQETLRSALADIGEVEEFGAVSAAIASETVRNAAIAVGVAALAILLYITWAFRKMPRPFRYGACAIVALIHDVVIVMGIFSFLGRALNWEIDPMFITAVLAVIGYSVNDTIVVFDRLRENLPRGVAPDFRNVVNVSLTQTLTRSLNTSITTILAVLAVYLFVGGTIQTFIMALLVGTVAGTYSSIFIASQLLVIWEQGKLDRFFPRISFLPRRLRKA
ncbi:protein translocase subunit SecF [Chloroflexota bacterium]